MSLPQSGQVFGAVAGTGAGALFTISIEKAEAAPPPGNLGTVADVKAGAASFGAGPNTPAPEADAAAKSRPALPAAPRTGKLGKAADVAAEDVEVRPVLLVVVELGKADAETPESVEAKPALVVAGVGA